MLVLIGARGQAAWRDTHTWAEAGAMANAYVEETYSTLTTGAIAPSKRPVLRAGIARIHKGAYVLHWGFADRFRAPFPETPRPVWPWRPVFDGPEMARDSVTWPESNLRWPFESDRRMVPNLRVTHGEPGRLGQVISSLEISASQIGQSGPLMVFEGAFPGARFEVLCFTELGYGIGLYGGPKVRGPMQRVEGGEIPAPFGGAISLRELMLLQPGGTGSGGPQLWQVIALAADFGATEAYLEFRAVDDARGVLDRAVGASDWIHLVWDAALRDAFKPFDGFD